MPTSNTSSPVKRPALGRRAVSSHAIVTRTSPSTPGELSHSHGHQKAPVHKPHRPHVVGGAHRTHGRNPSFGKNLNKLQRLTSAQHLGAEGGIRHHQRKKSAPVTPAASPGGNHVHWDGLLEGEHKTSASMKKNNSSPALRRDPTGILGKKALVTDRPQSSTGKKKTVGFELAESVEDDGEWEDTTQSPESTRRNSVAQSKDSAENSTVLVDPLTFVKRSYPQFPRATSLPEPSSKSFAHEDHSSEEDEEEDKQVSDIDEHRDQPGRLPDHQDIASRLLSPSHSAKAPPAMSSISAMVKPTAVDTISRNASLTNLAAAHDGSRRSLSTSNPALGNTPGNLTQATSSSIEGGISRFIVNNKSGIHATSRTDSDPNTPSSFLPHYHPQTPPSPARATGPRKTKTSPPARLPGTEPPSRTQQKLWLQRTAALNTSPPDSHGASTTVPPSAIDPAFMAATHARPGSGPYDTGRGTVNGSARAGVAVHDSEAKHIRKAYEKAASELTVVRRFQSPTGDSFNRLKFFLDKVTSAAAGVGQTSSLSKPVKSAPALTLLQKAAEHNKQDRAHSDPEPDDLVTNGNPVPAAIQEPQSQHPSYRILSTSDEAAHGHAVTEEPLEDRYFTSESEMMIRRMWESREVATSG